jgi:type IV pilus assembly protein PilW
MRIPSIFKQKEGVTLIELLVSFVICGIVIGAIYRLFIVQTRAYTVQDQVVEVQQNVRSAMEIMLRDLRMTGYDDDSTASKAAGIDIPTPIAVFTDGSITVNYEYYDSVAAQYQRHTVAYSLVAGNLVRQRDRNPPGDSTTETLLENVDALAFTYGRDTDQDGDVDNWVTAAGVGPYTVIAVSVTLTARSASVNPDVQMRVSPRTLTSAVSFRNLIK